MDISVPPYYGLHSVKLAGWNYATDARTDVETQCSQKEFLVDFARGPPKYNSKIVSKDATLASMDTVKNAQAVVQDSLLQEFNIQDESEVVTEPDELEELRIKEKILVDVHTPLSAAQRNRDRFERLTASHRDTDYDHMVEVALV